MPQAIKLIDAEGRSCIYVPIMEDGKVVDSQGLCLIRRTNDHPRTGGGSIIPAQIRIKIS